MIYLDSRVGSKDLLPHFPKGTAEITKLEFADAFFSGNGPHGPVLVGIEVKRIPDVLQCIKDGRFVGYQLEGMMRDYHYNFLIIEGACRANPKTGAIQTPQGKKGWQDYPPGKPNYFPGRNSWYGFQKWKLSLQIIQDLVIIHTQTRRQTAQQIYCIYQWWNEKEFVEHRAHLKPKQLYEGFTKMSTRRKVALAFPNVGHTLAKRLEDRFPSARALVNASPKDWMEVEGIGKSKAQKVEKELS